MIEIKIKSLVKFSTFKNQLIVLKLNWYKIKKFKFKMRFKVSMINDQGNRHEETVIANNEEEAKGMF